MAGRKWYQPAFYYTLDNWWYNQKVKYNCNPSFEEFSGYYSRSSAGSSLAPSCSPSTLKGIYNRLVATPNNTIGACLGISGHCAPLAYYRNIKPFYMSKEAYGIIKKRIEKAQ